jgi:Tfp pilus assembly protein PilE
MIPVASASEEVTMSQAPQQNAPTSGLAIAALIFTFVCFPIGVILAIVALVKINNSNGALGGKTLAIVALALSVGAVPIVGILAAIAIPNFIMFQCRSKQSEAKGNLKALYVGEMSYFAEKNTYSNDANALGFQPRGNILRYDYVITEAGPQLFRAEARGKNEMTGDLWVIDQTGQPQNVDNVCNR